MKLKVLAAIAGVSILGLAVWMGNLAAWGQKIYPGVRVADVKVGGMTKAAAEVAVAKKLSGVKQIELAEGKNLWKVAAADIDWEYDPRQTIETTMKVGRRGTVATQIREIYSAWRQGKKITPSFTINENKLAEAVTKVAGQVNVPASEPEVTIDATTGAINISAGEDGQVVDEQRLDLLIREKIGQVSSGPIQVPLIYLRPKLSDAQMTAAKARAEKIVGKKMILNFTAGKQSWEIDDDQLVAWMDPQNQGWKRSEIENWVAELAQAVDRPAQNASFRFVGGGRVEEFKPAAEGYQIKQAETTEAIMTALAGVENSAAEAKADLAAEQLEPQIKNGDVNSLGIKELLGRGESWFTGSIDNRIYNLARAAAAINGTLVAPGEVFSFNQTIGEVSAATGYKQAYVIKEGKTVLGDGGGVCQTSTTLFRAVLAAGLPIEERVAHAYRVSYYEENYQPGFDATVFQPSPDFKFKNDTAGYVLVQTTFDEVNKHLIFDLYGTSDGRVATVSKARMWDVTAPPPDLYVDDPTQPVGKIVQTEHKAWGAKVAFDWKVTRGDQVLQERTFYSNFQPWQAVYLRGTKTN